jgi:hypothetical protein
MEDWFATNVTIPAASRKNALTNFIRKDQTTSTTPVRQGDPGTTQNVSPAATSDMVFVRWQHL